MKFRLKKKLAKRNFLFKFRDLGKSEPEESTKQEKATPPANDKGPGTESRKINLPTRTKKGIDVPPMTRSRKIIEPPPLTRSRKVIDSPLISRSRKMIETFSKLRPQKPAVTAKKAEKPTKESAEEVGSKTNFTDTRSSRIKNIAPHNRNQRSIPRENLMTATKVYMQSISKGELLTKEEEIELSDIIHNGSEDARQAARTRLIEANLRLVVKIAHGFKSSVLPLRDLISAGNVGLIHAVEKFDPTKGARFGSYAVWWIKQSIRRALDNQSRTIRIPVQSAAKLKKIKVAMKELHKKLDREPSNAEIADHLDFSERTVASLRQADLHFFSLYDTIQQGEEGEYQDIIPDKHAPSPDQVLGKWDSIDQVETLLNRLNERERAVLIMRFGLRDQDPQTLEEVAQRIGRTRERVRQIQNMALNKIRKMMTK